MDFLVHMLGNVPIDLFLNVLFVSIPEELFFVVFSLILLKKFDFLNFKQENVRKITFAVVIPAVLSNMIRVIPGSITNLMPLIGIVSITLSIILTFRFFSIKEIFTTFICVTLSSIIIMAIELAYFPILLYGTTIDPEVFNKPSMIGFLFTLPERFIEYSSCVYILLKKKSFIRFNLLVYSLKHRSLGIMISLLTAINLLYICMMARLVFYDQILFDLGFTKQLIGITVITMFPIANIIAIFFITYYVSSLEAQKKYFVQEDLKVSISDIEFFLRRGEYDKIYKELKYVENSADQLD